MLNLVKLYMNSAFLIRGHHLGFYAELASWRSDPQDLAEALVEGRLRDRSRTHEQQVYAKDVIGTSTEQAGLVLARYRSIFTRFVQLEKDYPVIITTGAKDHICQSCIIGNHCSARGSEMSVDVEEGRLQVYESDLGDMFYIHAFKKLAGRLAERGHLVDPALGTYSVAYVPEPTQGAIPILGWNNVAFEPPLLANAGYVKAVLSQWGLTQRLRY